MKNRIHFANSILGLFLGLFLISCKRSEKNAIPQPPLEVPAEVRLKISTAEKLDDVFELVSVVQLENHDDGIIADATQEFWIGPDDEFIFDDAPNNRVIFFQKDGRWLGTLSYEDIWGPGPRDTRINRVHIWSEKKIILAFLNRSCLIVVDLNKNLMTDKICIKDQTSILDFAITSRRELVLLTLPYSALEKKFLILNQKGRHLREFDEHSSRRFPNRSSMYFNFHILSIDHQDIIYLTNGFEPNIYKYDVHGELLGVFARDSPHFPAPEKDFPVQLDRKTLKRMRKASLFFRHDLLENNLILVTAGLKFEIRYDFASPAGGFLNPAPLPASFDGAGFSFEAVKDDRIYAVVMPQLNQIGDYGNPAVRILQIRS